MNIAENQRLGNFLRFEINRDYCRETMKIAEGQNLKIGEIVGLSTTTNEIKALSLDAEDGTDVSFGIVIDNYDATRGCIEGIVVARGATITNPIFPTNATEEQKNQITKSLELRGIIIRKTA